VLSAAQASLKEPDSGRRISNDGYYRNASLAPGATVTRMTKALSVLVHLRNLKFTLFKGSAEIDPDCFLDHPTLQRAETQRNLGTPTRIWNRPAPPGTGPRADGPDPEAPSV